MTVSFSSLLAWNHFTHIMKKKAIYDISFSPRSTQNQEEDQGLNNSNYTNPSLISNWPSSLIQVLPRATQELIQRQIMFGLFFLSSLQTLKAQAPCYHLYLTLLTPIPSILIKQKELYRKDHVWCHFEGQKRHSNQVSS